MVSKLNGLRETVPPLISWHLFKSLLDVIVYLHGHRGARSRSTPIAHGDMHTENIMVSCNESTPNGLPQLKLIDFGSGAECVIDSIAAMAQDLLYLGNTLHRLAHPDCPEHRMSDGTCREINRKMYVRPEFSSRSFGQLMRTLSKDGRAHITALEVQRR